ncbi:P2X purinoceptor 7-like [Saccostrea echinata]|uniref:P2X purinoceptor 7-like n=1 Tax=Saccostrea echinata TaxID=191078 RepID=UPI002A82671E|nr:P2X purinoceptor 7-like [Saccostrea echinata]
MRETLMTVVQENPEYLFNILGTKEPHLPEASGPSQPSWCVCTFCKEMPTEKEQLCCQKSEDSCISRLPDFNILMLDEAVLALARLYRQDILAMLEDEDRNRANRHTAYRQFVLWHHGKLQVGDRRVIPSC